MGAERIEQVVAALTDAGFRVSRGYPQGKMPDISSPVAAVQLQEQNMETVTVVVDVFCSAQSGGQACEDETVRAAAALEDMGGQCTVGNCSFSGKTGLFSAQVRAKWVRSLPVTVLVGETELPYVTAVSAQQRWETYQTTSDGYVTMKLGWAIELEEQLPLTETFLPGSERVFDLTVISEGRQYLYQDCYWNSTTCQMGPSGVNRKREAWTWETPTETEV